MRVHRPVKSCCLLAGLALALANSNTRAQVGSWRMELGSGQTVLDYAGPHHGVLGTTNAAEASDPVWATSGFIGRALQFDGDDLVTINDTTALQLTKDMTICASFYIDAFNGDWVRVVGKMADSSRRNYGLWYHPNGTALFQIYGANNVKANAQINARIVVGQWYTFVGVKQGTSIRLYVNGTRVASASLPVLPLTSTAPVTIGKAPPIHAGHKGRIDQVAIYNRALSDSEIRTRYSFVSFAADTKSISIANGGTQNLTLNAGAAFGGKNYWVFGSATGILPGVVVTGIPVLLNPDPYTDILMAAVNSAVFSKFRGTLSTTGTATASLIVPAKLSIPVGFRLYHAFLVYDGATGQIHRSSNPVSAEFK